MKEGKYKRNNKRLTHVDFNDVLRVCYRAKGKPYLFQDKPTPEYISSLFPNSGEGCSFRFDTVDKKTGIKQHFNLELSSDEAEIKRLK